MKRFYTRVGVDAVDGGWQVSLDGKPVKTIGGKPQIVPNAAMAEALADEWRDQAEILDPARLRLRAYADSAIDQVASARADTLATLLRYGETDTLCYRAEPGEALFRQQEEKWEPLLAEIEAREGVRFERISGIIHRSQPDQTLQRLRKRLETENDFVLAGLQSAVAIAASLVVGLAVLDGKYDGSDLFALSELEEDWQIQMWGSDAEAESRRAKRASDFASAAEFIKLACKGRGTR